MRMQRASAWRCGLGSSKRHLSAQLLALALVLLPSLARAQQPVDEAAPAQPATEEPAADAPPTEQPATESPSGNEPVTESASSAPEASDNEDDTTSSDRG